MTLHGPAPTVPVPGNTSPEDGTLRWNALSGGNKTRIVNRAKRSRRSSNHQARGIDRQSRSAEGTCFGELVEESFS